MVSPYDSPEVAAGCRYIDEKADVYSFGIILHELFTNRYPFPDESQSDPSSASPEPFQFGRSHRFIIPQPHPSAPHFLAEIMRACWRIHPADRPTSSEIGDLLVQLSELFS